MKTISFVNSKGGSGKTTSSINICQGLTQLKHKVALLDADAFTGKAAWLLAQESSGYDFDFATLTRTGDLKPMLEKLSAYDFVVIDTPPSFNTPWVDEIIANSVMAVIPTQISMLDVHSAVVVALECKPKLKTRMLFTMVGPNSQTKLNGIQTAMLEMNVKFLPHHLRRYEVYQDAAAQNLSVLNFPAGIYADKAKNDIMNVALDIEASIAFEGDYRG